MGGTDKILAELGGLPVLSRTLRVFDDHDMIDTIIVVAREEQMPKISRVCSPYHKVRIVVPGGNSRQESVMHGLEACLLYTSELQSHFAHERAAKC